MYALNLGAWNAVFAVPCAVVDQHLKLASPNQLKVLLWVLRNAGHTFEIQNITSALAISPEEVEDALLYWEQDAGLILRNGIEFKPSQVEPSASMEPPTPIDLQNQSAAVDPAPQPAKKPAAVLTRPQKPDNAFVAKRMTESQEIAFLMQEAQSILGRLLSNGCSATLLMLHDDFGLPADVILMLLQYAASAGKTSTRYIEKVGMDWAEEEIFTHEKAEEKLRRIAENAKAWHVVEQSLGITKRSPTAKEESFAAAWVNDWHFSAAMIRQAYERCVDTKGQLSLSYMNGILTRWHDQGIGTVQQAEEEKAKKLAARKQESARKSTYNIDEYERSGAFDTFDGK
ncbi:DnaD domain protein [Anaeromassilibacillus senegalensis]|uniref:DnaD domain protein n=1 Tax=Anaeromassilibacillus senegalensis TaxID=1673717 RepID=UPI000B0AA952|nr:DnaD domain protein [Anaeromassilibacillus senegalensis]